MILIGEEPLSIKGNKLLLQMKVVPRVIRPFRMFTRFFNFKEVVSLDSDYSYYCFDACYLINYLKKLRRNKKDGEKII